MVSQGIQERYPYMLSEFLNNSENRYLLMAADLGNEPVMAGVPPEEIVEIHEVALEAFDASSPNPTIAETRSLVSSPLMELLMAYGSAFREQWDSRKMAEDTQLLRSEQLQALTNTAAILAKPDSLEEKQNLVLEEIAELMQADGVVFRRIDDAGTEFTGVGQTGPMYEIVQPSSSPVLSFRTYHSGETLVLNDYATDPDGLQYAIQLGVESAVLQPVRAFGQVFGVIGVMSKDLNQFTENRVQVLTAISDGLGVLLENARLYEEARERAAEIERFNEYTNRILDNNPCAMAVITGDDREIMPANRSFSEFWGVDHRPIVGQPITRVLPLAGLAEFIAEFLSSNPEDRPRNELSASGR